MTEHERRTNERRRPNAGCYVAYIEGTGSIRDLSLAGAFVLDAEPLPVGEMIKFSLRDGAVAISLQGIVTRSEPKTGMAVRFTDLSKEDVRRLKIYILGLGPQNTAESKPQPLKKVLQEANPER